MQVAMIAASGTSTVMVLVLIWSVMVVIAVACMLLLHPAPTCADASDPCTSHWWSFLSIKRHTYSTCARVACSQHLLQFALVRDCMSVRFRNAIMPYRTLLFAGACQNGCHSWWYYLYGDPTLGENT